jgi:putative redox protein
MHVIYEFTGMDLPLEKLQKAVDLSEEKYCGVRAVYKKALELTSEIRIIEA